VKAAMDLHAAQEQDGCEPVALRSPLAEGSACLFAVKSLAARAPWNRLESSGPQASLNRRRQIVRKGNPMKLRLSSVFALVIALAACASLARSQVSEKAVQRIQKEVRHELLMLPYFGVFDNIAYKVDGYNVTLLDRSQGPA